MVYRFHFAACLATVALCLLAAALDPLSISVLHYQPGNVTVAGVFGARFVYQSTSGGGGSNERWGISIDPSEGSAQAAMSTRIVPRPSPTTSALTPQPPPPSTWAGRFLSPPVWDFASANPRAEVPLGWVAMIAAVAAVGPYLLVALRGRSRLRSGCCHACGYDLRETPGQCPECATPPADAMARRRWPLALVPPGPLVARVVAVAGVLCFLLFAAVGGTFRWVASQQVAADFRNRAARDRAQLVQERLQAQQQRLRNRDSLTRAAVTEFVIATSPRLNGGIQVGLPPFITPAQRYQQQQSGNAAIPPGTLILLPPGEFELPVSNNLADVAIVGAKPGATRLRVHLASAKRVRLENLTIDCNDDPFLEFNQGGSASLSRCEVVNYNSGAGGSNAAYGSGATLLIEECLFDGTRGRSAGPDRFGNAFDLRGDNRVYVRNSKLIHNQEIARSDDVTYEGCTLEAQFLPGTDPAMWGPNQPRFHLAGSRYSTGDVCQLAVDDQAFIDLVLKKPGAKGDPFSLRLVAGLDCAKDPIYWLALSRNARPGIREIARRQLTALGFPTRITPPPAADALPALFAQLEGPDSEVIRAAVRVLATAPPELVKVIDDYAGTPLSLAARGRLAQVRLLRNLAVPLEAEVEYTRLAAQIIP